MDMGVDTAKNGVCPGYVRSKGRLYRLQARRYGTNQRKHLKMKKSV